MIIRALKSGGDKRDQRKKWYSTYLILDKLMGGDILYEPAVYFKSKKMQ